MEPATLKRWCTNALIAAVVGTIAFDTLPQAPAALHRVIEPTLVRLGVNQGPWYLFSPEPDKTNTRYRAEIAYRDGERRTWEAPVWAQASAWDKWAGHRHFEWYDHIGWQKYSHVYEPWARHIARSARPDLPNADQGAEVKIFYQEAEIGSAGQKPWKSFRERAVFDEGWILTIEKLE